VTNATNICLVQNSEIFQEENDFNANGKDVVLVW
jgi:hypothetical protein